MEWLVLERWSPYAVGIGIGIVSWLTFLLLNKPLSCSTTFARSSGMIESLFRGSERVKTREYFQKFPPVIDWQWLLVIGIIIGACISSVLSGTFSFDVLSSQWVTRFGETPVYRILAAVAGGLIMGLGARWAGGCTSGHGISGVLQMTVSGWIAAICFFAGGIVTAFLIY